jgi:hypothetical protein
MHRRFPSHNNHGAMRLWVLAEVLSFSLSLPTKLVGLIDSVDRFISIWEFWSAYTDRGLGHWFDLRSCRFCIASHLQGGYILEPSLKYC